eukprot:m.16493 g.16493  ORF g.16493 m.16493 type:complete len:189 (-) comp8094_c0_seq1:162-728(-)
MDGQANTSTRRNRPETRRDQTRRGRRKIRHSSAVQSDGTRHALFLPSACRRQRPDPRALEPLAQAPLMNATPQAQQPALQLPSSTRPPTTESPWDYDELTAPSCTSTSPSSFPSLVPQAPRPVVEYYDPSRSIAPDVTDSQPHTPDTSYPTNGRSLTLSVKYIDNLKAAEDAFNISFLDAFQANTQHD